MPLATNLGVFWPAKGRKRPGLATLEFLPPIAAGDDKDGFLRQLDAAIEARVAELVADATGRPPAPAILIARPDETPAPPQAALQ